MSNLFLVRAAVGGLMFVAGVVCLVIGLFVGGQLVTTGVLLMVGGFVLALVGGAATAYLRDLNKPARSDNEDSRT